MQHTKEHDLITEPNRKILKETNKSNYTTDTIYRKRTNTTRKEILLGKTNRHGNTGRSWGEVTKLEKDCNFPDFTTEYLISKS